MKRFDLRKSKCSFCAYGLESAIHLFKDCWWFKALWSALYLNESHLNIQFSSFADWIYYLSISLTNDEFRTAIISFWYTWYNRNLIFHGGNGMDIYATSVKIRFFIKGFQNTPSVYQTNSQSVYLNWIVPINGFVKVKCDAFYISVGAPTGLGVICRDQNRVVIASKSLVFNNINCCLDAEEMMLQQGMILANELKLGKVIFETDNTSVAEIIWFGVTSSQSSQSRWHRFCIEEFC